MGNTITCLTAGTVFDCPHCSPNSGRFRLGIPEDTKGAVSCWGCGPHRLADTLADAAKVSVGEVLKLLKEYGGDTDYTRTEVKPGGKLILPDGVGPLLRPHRRYLEERGLDPEEVSSLWGVGGIGLAASLSWHLFLPIRIQTETVSWTCRSLVSDGRRYTSALPHQEKVHLRDLLYGEENARNTVVIVEGAPDVWTFGPGAVALLGTGYSDAQVHRLSQYPVRVVCLNAERDAQRRARTLCQVLRVFQGDTFNVVLESGKDVNECWQAGRAGRREVMDLKRRFQT